VKKKDDRKVKGKIELAPADIAVGANGPQSNGHTTVEKGRVPKKKQKRGTQTEPSEKREGTQTGPTTPKEGVEAKAPTSLGNSVKTWAKRRGCPGIPPEKKRGPENPSRRGSPKKQQGK